MTNEEIIQKAVITTDALAAAGQLNDAQSDKFIDYIVDETVLKNNARVVRFREANMEIDKIGVGTRVAFPKTEAQDPGLRRGITTSKITLTPKTIIMPFEIGDQFREINIEGEGIEDTIIRLMARQLANDMEELYIGGDTVGPAILEGDYKDGGSETLYIKDDFLALFDGWERLADGGNIVDAEAANVGLSVFGKLLRAMPTKFRRNRNNLRWFMSPDLAQLYYEKIATRATALGDAAAGGSVHKPYGVPIVEVPLMQLLPQVVQHITLAASATVSLRYGPVSSVVVLPSDLAQTPTAKYIEDTDYSVDYTAGSITNLDSGIGDGDVVKITYQANPQILLTHMMNYLIGIGRDIRIEKDRDIFKGVNQYAVTAKIACEFEEDTALVKGTNIGTGL